MINHVASAVAFLAIIFGLSLFNGWLMLLAIAIVFSHYVDPR